MLTHSNMKHFVISTGKLDLDMKRFDASVGKRQPYLPCCVP